MLTVYAPGVSVEVKDGTPVPPASVGGSGSLTVYAPGVSVEVVEVADTPTFDPSSIQFWPFSMGRFVAFTKQFTGVGERYDRFQQFTEIDKPTTLEFRSSLLGSGTRYDFLATDYPIRIDGEVVAAVGKAVGKTATVTLTPEMASHGWHLVSIDVASGESNVPYWMYFDRGGPAPKSYPVCPDTYEMATKGVYYTAMVPYVAPRAVPAPLRECPAFSTALSPRDLFRENIIPARVTGIYRPNVTAKGVLTSFNRQAYFYSDVIRHMPAVPLLDGPRGVGTMQMATHLQIGRRGSCYFLDPWRFGHVSEDGTIKTLFGFVQDHPHPQWQSPAKVRLKGDWSAVPIERQRLNEGWGFDWDGRTTVTDPNADPIDGEQPHVFGPVVYVADGKRLLAGVFSKNDRSVEPKMIEVGYGMFNDAWDIRRLPTPGRFAVSERGAHRIIEVEVTLDENGIPVSCSVVRVLVQGVALSTMGSDRVHRLAGVTVAAARSVPVVAPEGLSDVIDGHMWFASNAQRSVRKFNVETLEVIPVYDYAGTAKSKFAKIAVTPDNSFGPTGTLFIDTWDLENFTHFGLPKAILPDGKEWVLYNYDFSLHPMTRGRGGRWDTLSYGHCTAVRMGRLFHSSSMESLIRLSQALDTDAVPTTASTTTIKNGRDKFVKKGYKPVYGDDGYGGLPLPWGEDPDMDQYFIQAGHSR